LPGVQHCGSANRSTHDVLLLSLQACVIQGIERVRAGNTAAPQSGRSTAALAAAIAVPVAAVLLLSAAAALLLIRKRQRRQHVQAGDAKQGAMELTGAPSTGSSSKHRSRDNK
jgi:uncharacterized membrane protein YozB (DUF420 family)